MKQMHKTLRTRYEERQTATTARTNCQRLKYLKYMSLTLIGTKYVTRVAEEEPGLEVTSTDKSLAYSERETEPADDVGGQVHFISSEEMKTASTNSFSPNLHCRGTDG